MASLFLSLCRFVLHTERLLTSYTIYLYTGHTKYFFMFTHFFFIIPIRIDTKKNNNNNRRKLYNINLFITIDIKIFFCSFYCRIDFLLLFFVCVCACPKIAQNDDATCCTLRTSLLFTYRSLTHTHTRM